MNKKKLLCKDPVHHFWSLTIKQSITGTLLFMIQAGELALFDILGLILQSQIDITILKGTKDYWHFFCLISKVLVM